MFEAVPYSSASIFCTCATCVFGGIMREIMLVPLLCRREGKGRGGERRGGEDVGESEDVG
jgi:hypothetical protein